MLQLVSSCLSDHELQKEPPCRFNMPWGMLFECPGPLRRLTSNMPWGMFLRFAALPRSVHS